MSLLSPPNQALGFVRSDDSASRNNDPRTLRNGRERDVNYKDFAGLCDVQYPRAFRYPLWRRSGELIEMQIEIFDPHTGSWKDQSKATEGRAKAVGLTA